MSNNQEVSYFQKQVKNLLSNKNAKDKRTQDAEDYISAALLKMVNKILDNGKYWWVRDRSTRVEKQFEWSRQRYQKLILDSLRHRQKKVVFFVCSPPKGLAGYEIADLCQRVMKKFGYEILLRLQDLLELDDIKVSFGFRKQNDISLMPDLVFTIEVF